MNSFKVAIALLLFQFSFFGHAQTPKQQSRHELSLLTESQLGIDYVASNAAYLESIRVIPTMPVGARNALLIRTLEQLAHAEHGIMPGQLKTPRYEQIFVAATTRRYVVQTLLALVQQAGDDYTSSLVSAVLNAEQAWLQMMLRNLLAPEDYLAMSRKGAANMLQSMLTDTNFQVSYQAFASEDFLKPRKLAYAIFVIALAQTCTDKSQLCDRAIPE